jgi:superfamily II DNA/RNA helicase
MKIRNENHVQKCFFSATMPDWVQQIIREQMRKDRVSIDLCKNLKNKAAKTIEHLKIDIRGQDRIFALSQVRKRC